MLLQFQEFLKGDASRSPFDACVAGAGVAGITLALDLAEQGRRVLLLEGGDVDFTEQSQYLYAGANVGRDYFDLDVARLRHLGGTSNHWAGFCRPLDGFDFEAREDIEGSGWPITKEELAPWLEPAANILEINSAFSEDRPVDRAEGNLRRITIQLSPPVRFRDKYLETLKESDRVWTVLNANLVDIRLSDGLNAVKAFAVAGYDNPSERVEIEAKAFILALGGIENARALLNADSQMENGVGNGHDLVGRYFMEHFELDVGHVLLNAPMVELFPDLWEDERVGRAVSFAVTKEFTRAKGVLNCELRLTESSEWQAPPFAEGLKARLKRFICDTDVLAELATKVDSTFKQTKCFLAHEQPQIDPDEFDAYIRVTCEQAPNPESRIRLADDRDAFGLRRAALDWNVLPIDKATLKEGVVELGRVFAEADIGRIRVAAWLLDEEAEIAGLPEGERAAGFHHIGATRMGHGPEDGVVDRDGRVFGVDNLYIAGSSIFATGGHAPPTLTIVQLALRLAHHLAAKLA